MGQLLLGENSQELGSYLGAQLPLLEATSSKTVKSSDWNTAKFACSAIVDIEQLLPDLNQLWGMGVRMIDHTYEGTARSFGFSSGCYFPNGTQRVLEVNGVTGTSKTKNGEQRRIDSISADFLVQSPDGKIITIGSYSNTCDPRVKLGRISLMNGKVVSALAVTITGEDIVLTHATRKDDLKEDLLKGDPQAKEPLKEIRRLQDLIRYRELKSKKEFDGINKVILAYRLFDSFYVDLESAICAQNASQPQTQQNKNY